MVYFQLVGGEKAVPDLLVSLAEKGSIPRWRGRRCERAPPGGYQFFIRATPGSTEATDARLPVSDWVGVLDRVPGGAYCSCERGALHNVHSRGGEVQARKARMWVLRPI